MGRNLIAYVIWCGGHQLVSEFGGLLGSLTHFCPFIIFGQNIRDRRLRVFVQIQLMSRK